ncbi:lipocalin family protein [Chryseobacterium sp.]|uniref:lipocalin family protein n=1 Tax=Chryseobacterium sp. TaxID=1871047 RepID=UPI0016291729|nr:lipocalin family protein [Chryseobacterium sp.]
MKKLALIFAAILLLVITGCNNTEDQPTYSIVGNWQPVKRVETRVTNSTPVSETYIYTDCQKESRWVFNEDSSGKQTTHDEVGTICATTSDKNFTYAYDKNSTKLQMSFQGVIEYGRVISLDNENMNIIIEKTVANVYSSDTYTFKKIN